MLVTGPPKAVCIGHSRRRAPEWRRYTRASITGHRRAENVSASSRLSVLTGSPHDDPCRSASTPRRPGCGELTTPRPSMTSNYRGTAGSVVFGYRATYPPTWSVFIANQRSLPCWLLR